MSEKKYEGFTVGLALVDAIPVVVFGLSFVLLGIAYGHPLFLIGAGLCFAGGLVKVLWKLIVAVSGKDIVWMNKQFRFTMMGGFVLILVSLFWVWTGVTPIDWAQVGLAVISFPSVILFALGLCGMVAMGVLGSKLDPTDVKSNWTEQLVNSFAQICIFLGILFAIL